MKNQILPSIIANNQTELNERFNKVKNLTNNFHVDIMDNGFVKNTFMNFNFKLPRKIKNKKTNYEAHLMMHGHKAMHWIKKNKNKVNLIIIHHEANNFKPLLAHLKKQKTKTGIALKPSTSINKIKEYLNDIDQVLLYIASGLGNYGGKFLPSMLNKIKRLRKLKPNLDIEVDGGVNNKIIKKLKKAGANKFVIGSYLQNSKEIKKDFDGLKGLIK